MERLGLISNHLAGEAPYTKILTEIYNGNVGIVLLNSPKDLNALSKTMRSEICRAVRAYERNGNVKVILLASTVKSAFCAGADIKEFENLSEEDMKVYDIFREISDTLENCTKPIIGAINGVALGGGCEVALKCDILVAANNARFGLPELRLGLIPGIGGTQRLTRLVGRSLASKLIYTSEFLGAKDALSAGLVSDLFEPEELLNKAKEIAVKVAEKSLTALKVAKECIKASENMTMTDGNQFERDVFTTLLDQDCKKEGVDAFIKKRKADFSKM